VTGLGFAPLCALAAVALVLAQYAFPRWPGYHVWQYAAALALLAAPVIGRAFDLRRPSGGASTSMLVALLGALVIIATGLGSGLLGPDTEIVQRAPGTVAPLPDVGAAAFFPNANAQDVARGDEGVVLRRRSGPPLAIAPGGRRLVGATELELVPRIAAYVEARDARGERLTVTQPTNPSFLSPVLLFPQRVDIAGKSLPADAFATPALRRQIKAFYFSKADSDVARAHGMAGFASILFAVDDEGGRPLPGGIGFARGGTAVDLGGVRLLPTIGTYPALAISAVPYPPALALGGLLVLGGIGLGISASLGGRGTRPGL
jgi:hypothetical protein